MSDYEELAKSGDWESIQNLIVLYANSDDREEQKQISKSLYYVENKKKLIAAFYSALKRITDLQRRFVTLKLALRISRPAFLFEYLSCSFQLGVKPKGTGLFEKDIRPFSDYEKSEVVHHIVTNIDFRPRIIHLAGEENLLAIQKAALERVKAGTITNDIMRCISSNLEYAAECQAIIQQKIVSDSDAQSTFGRYLDINDPINQNLIASFSLTSAIWDASAHNIWLEDRSRISFPIMRILMKVDKGGFLSSEEWSVLKKRIDQDLETLGDIDSSSGSRYFMFLRAIGQLDENYQESVLIQIYDKTRIYSSRALQELVFISSPFAYRELLNALVTTNSSEVRIRYALKIAKNYKDNIGTLYRTAKALNDELLLEVLERHGISEETVPSLETPRLMFADINRISVIDDKTVVSDLLTSIANEIKATTFFCAVGFAYRSGLKMIMPVINSVSESTGSVELIIGSLQDYCVGNKNTRIDRSSAEYIQKLIERQAAAVFGYPETFYHGKFYYLTNGQKSVVLLGSSNVSKTAFLNNYELDLLLEFDKDSEADKAFVSWYSGFKGNCVQITNIDTTRFEEFTWTGTGDAISRITAHKENIGQIKQRVAALSDAETRYRLNLWLQYSPAEIFSQLAIEALANYMVFLYPEEELAVFESFVPGNAYYTFKYTDFESLLSQVAKLTKTQMLLASNFLGRGYHIQEKERLEERISMFFVKEKNDE
jgi:HKD family nuclease